MALYAFDGTWNDSRAPDSVRDKAKDTNVYQFLVRYSETRFYLDGVGSRKGVVGKLIGGITGWGARTRINEQFQSLSENFQNGDTSIDVIGYSRGATVARMFVQRIGRDFSKLSKGGRPLEEPPAIRFLGLFDTVASLGVPWTSYEHDFKPDIPDFVENTFHAMALDESRETFGIERCLGNRNHITEVWFRGGHGDIGGNAIYEDASGARTPNRQRSDIALEWMVRKARSCHVPVSLEQKDEHDELSRSGSASNAPPVTAKGELLKIGNVGTQSRRTYIGDLVHYSTERSELTTGIDGRLLRRIAVPTRIEDEKLENSAAVPNWYSVAELKTEARSIAATTNPSLIELSSRRYPFDVQPARTWRAWLDLWELDKFVIDANRLEEFWAPTSGDRGLAWDIYVELKTRITTEDMNDDEGDEKAALNSVFSLFPVLRENLHKHGVQCANAALLVNAFLSQRVRPFTAKWHKESLAGMLDNSASKSCKNFRVELKQLQPTLRDLAKALAHLADAEL